MSGFGRNLSARREALHLTQEDLAKRSGVTQQAISLIEAGKRSPTENTMDLLAEALGCGTSDLVDGGKKEKQLLTHKQAHLLKEASVLNDEGIDRLILLISSLKCDPKLTEKSENLAI